VHPTLAIAAAANSAANKQRVMIIASVRECEFLRTSIARSLSLANNVA
jgi:hypothetical protein